MRRIATELLVEGESAAAPVLVLGAPISFWGGVDPASGRIADVRHPQHGECLAGRFLVLPGTIGSSSASAVLLELVAGGHAPAAIVMPRPDAILLLGLVVAQEMGHDAPPAARLDYSVAVTLAGGTARLRGGFIEVWKQGSAAPAATA